MTEPEAEAVVEMLGTCENPPEVEGPDGPGDDDEGAQAGADGGAGDIGVRDL